MVCWSWLKLIRESHFETYCSFLFSLLLLLLFLTTFLHSYLFFVKNLSVMSYSTSNFLIYLIIAFLLIILWWMLSLVMLTISTAIALLFKKQYWWASPQGKNWSSVVSNITTSLQFVVIWAAVWVDESTYILCCNYSTLLYCQNSHRQYVNK